MTKFEYKDKIKYLISMNPYLFEFDHKNLFFYMIWKIKTTTI